MTDSYVTKNCERCGCLFLHRPKRRTAGRFCSTKCLFSRDESDHKSRFWSKVNKTSDGCWIWTGNQNHNGYGLFQVNHSTKSAHRMAWTYTFGPIPKGSGSHGVCVCHRCDNPLCMNPAHLFLGSHSENMADKVAKRRQAPMRGELAGNSKLTEASVRAILADNRSQRTIAMDYGVTQSCIYAIKARRSWAHISV